MRGVRLSRRAQLFISLGLSSLVSLGFFVISAINNHSLADWYLVWNLILAWLPIIFATLLIKSLLTRPWLNWWPQLLTLLWVGFLPNSFYLVSDLIHLQNVASQNLLYDSVMFESFILNGLTLGFLSLYLVHQQLLRRVKPTTAASLIGLTILLSSFAVYLGRDSRWNSWDLFVNPAGILFDVSDQFINFRTHVQALTITIAFFIFLSALYIIIRWFHRLLSHHIMSS